MAGLLEDPVQYESITQLATPWGPGQLTYNEGTQCALMVDEYSRVIVNDNQPAVNSSNGLFSPASVPTPWNEVGKCTYRVFIEFRKRGRHGVPDSKVSQWHEYGTAVHIGQGLFLSNAHVFSWPRDLKTKLPLTHFRYEAKVYLRSGSGDLHEKGIPGTGIFSTDLVAQVVGWPPTLLANALTDGYQVKGGLMENQYKIPLLGDVVLLKATTPRWLARMRGANRPYVLPSSLGGTVTPFPGTLVTINGDSEDSSRYSGTANTAERIEEALDSLLPNVVSYTSNNVEQYIIADDGARRAAVREEEPHILLYKISASPGSSGGGIYNDTTKRLVGLNTKSETRGQIVNHRDRTCAVALTSPLVRELIENCIIPELKKLKTEVAIRICQEWERLL
jgi:hypothetical protein